jgi:hypothetical protein
MLKTLPVNKTVVLFSPVEGDDVLTRTGVSNNSSLYHSILYATSSEYVRMDEKGRDHFVKKLKLSLKDCLSIEDWSAIKGSTRQFLTKLHFILLNFYRFVQEDPKAKGKSTRKVVKQLVSGKADKMEYYNLLSQLIPFTFFETKILKDSLRSKQSLEEIKKDILKTCTKYYNSIDEIKYLEEDKAEFFLKLLLDMLNTIFKEAEYSAHKLFVTTLAESTKVSFLLIHLLSQKLQRDIYIIDSSSRMPINDPELIQKRRSIVLLSHDHNYFEVVGKLHTGNKVQRDFSPEEMFISKFYTFVCEPRKIESLYPELIDYLDEEYKPTQTDYVDSGLDTQSESDLISESEESLPDPIEARKLKKARKTIDLVSSENHDFIDDANNFYNEETAGLDKTKNNLLDNQTNQNDSNLETEEDIKDELEKDDYNDESGSDSDDEQHDLYKNKDEELEDDEHDEHDDEHDDDENDDDENDDDEHDKHDEHDEDDDNESESKDEK